MERLRTTTRQTKDQQVRKHRPDYWVVVLIVFLAAIGLTVVYAISPALSETDGGTGGQYVTRQLIAIGLSMIAFLVTSRIPLAVWRKWQIPLLGVAVLGTLMALATPIVQQYPAHRWIRLGGFSLQSVEILKFALLFSLSSFFVSRMREGSLGNSKRTLYPLGAIIAVIGVVVAIKQSDFGSTVVIMAMMAAMAWLVGMPLKRLGLIAVVLAIGGLLLISSTPYRRARVATFLHPDSNCLTTGYQSCQALIAVGSGGVIGQGIGNGAQAYGYLPEAQNDSIFAIYAEKFGFLGCVVLLGLFATLFWRLKLIIERTEDIESRLIVAAVLAWLSVQMIINVSAMVGLMPIKGITLPFVSYGGTSVLFVGAALGLVFQISHYTSFRSRNVRKDRP